MLCRRLLTLRLTFPDGNVISLRGILGDVIGHHTNQFSVRHGLPAMTLHRPSINKLASIVGILGVLQEVLEQIDGSRQIEVISV